MNNAGKTFQAADVLAGAYRSLGKNMGPRDGECLVHVVELDASGDLLRVLCRSVKLENLTTDAGPTDREPTCKMCAASLMRLGNRLT